MSIPRLACRAGVTLVELMISVVIMGIVVSSTLLFLNQQGTAIAAGNERMAVLQNLRFSANLLERELRAVGVGVVTGQPFIVYADSNVFAFNGDLVGVSGLAIYDDRNAPAGSTTALQSWQRITIPGTSFQYPSVDYVEPGGGAGGSAPSPAETIVFFFERDPASIAGDEYILYRQVNALAPEVVARNLRRTRSAAGGALLPFFEYYALDVDGRLVAFPPGTALAHTEPQHGGPLDRDAAAQIDEVRAVRVNLGTTNGRELRRRLDRDLTRLIHLPNAGQAHLETCGSPPVLGGDFAATRLDDERVRLTWSRSPDELDGERDVMMYLIWRRRPADPWGEPLVNLAPSGAAIYEFVDAGLDLTVDSYLYGLQVQDCNPSLSGMAVAGPVGG